MPRPWIKLWVKVLDDPKVGLLEPWLRWRMIELFLLAGDVDQDGLLPDLDHMAWRLRVPADELERDMNSLQLVGILERNGAGWQVRNFEKWQAPMTGAERQRRYRKRQAGES